MCICCHDTDTVIGVILRARAANRPLTPHEVTLVVQRLRHDQQAQPVRSVATVADGGRTTSRDEEEFEAGQRVRVRVSPECDVAFWGPHGIRGHPGGIDGAEGVISSAGQSDLAPWSDTHPYCVTFDRPRMVEIGDGGPPKRAEGNYFSGSELTPINEG